MYEYNEYVVYVVYEIDPVEDTWSPDTQHKRFRGQAYDAYDAEQRVIAMLIKHGAIEDSIFIEDVVEVPQWYMMQKRGEPMLPGVAAWLNKEYGIASKGKAYEIIKQAE